MKLNLKNRKGQNIVGDLEKPQGEINGTCIVQHGWGGNRNKATIQAIKNAFLETGFQTFNFDTTNSFGESDGDFEKSTLGLHAEDLADVVKWSQKQDWFIEPLALAGHSKGGYAILKYAEEHSDEISYLVPVAPLISGSLSFEANKKYNQEEFEKWQKDGVLVRIGREGNKKVQHWFQMEERLNHDLLPHASKLTMPTLIIVGSEDINCPVEHQQIMIDAIPGDNKQHAVIQAAPHSFHEETEREECKKIIKNWLTKRRV